MYFTTLLSATVLLAGSLSAAAPMVQGYVYLGPSPPPSPGAPPSKVIRTNPLAFYCCRRSPDTGIVLVQLYDTPYCSGTNPRTQMVYRGTSSGLTLANGNNPQSVRLSAAESGVIVTDTNGREWAYIPGDDLCWGATDSGALYNDVSIA